jgi:predicted  nucleic acid-binding Zn-ribbon protein
MFIKCVCNNCPGHIEFDDSSAGQTVTCPHCGVETVLYVPQGKPADKAPLPAPPTANIPSAATPPKRKNKNSALFVVVGFLFVVVAIGIASFVGTVKNRKPSAQKPDENLQEVKGAMGWNLGEVLPTNFQVNTNDDAFGITYDFNPPADMNIASDMCHLILTILHGS